MREILKERERQRDTEKVREIQIKTERYRERQRDTEKDREIQGKTERFSERQRKI